MNVSFYEFLFLLGVNNYWLNKTNLMSAVGKKN